MAGGSLDETRRALGCALHEGAFTYGCPGCLDALDRADDIAISAQVRKRLANDTGERISLDELIREQGFDPDELRAEIAEEDSA